MLHAIKDSVIEFFLNFPPELAVFFLSMLPITELRASIPIGIELLDLSVPVTWIMAVIGDAVPSFFLLLIFPKIHRWLLAQRFVGDLVKKKLRKAEQAFAGKYQRYGEIGLMLFVAIPLPFTGAWTGSLAAFIFNIPFRRSFPWIFAGIMIAALLVTLITLFAGAAVRGMFL